MPAAIRCYCFILALFCWVAPVQAEFQLQPRPSYSTARATIPGFPKERSNENWVLDLIPENWRVTSLDGEWKTKLIPSDAYVNYFDEAAMTPKKEELDWITPEALLEGWSTGQVPWSFAIRNFKGSVCDGGTMWYARDFVTPAYNAEQERVVIRFYGVGFRADVWVNGRHAGKHLGQYTAFDLDVTKLLSSDGKNRLVVRAIDTRFGMAWRARSSSGIAAPVQLHVRPLLEATKLRLAPKVATESLEFDFEPRGTVGAEKGRLDIKVSEFKSGKVVYTGKVDGALKAGVRFSGALPMAQAHLWHPDDPFLYVLSLEWNGTEISRQRFGFREVSIDRNAEQERIFLNGKRIYLRMFQFNNITALQYTPDKKTTSVNEYGRLRELILAMKYANVNSFRSNSGEPFMDQTFYNLCDELGIIMYMDMPRLRRLSPILNEPRGEPASTYRTLEAQLGLYPDLMYEFHNHPSLCMVSYGNELYSFLLPPGLNFSTVIKRYTDLHKQVDLQKRPTTGSAGGSILNEKTDLDVVDTHQYKGVYYGCQTIVNEYIKDEASDIRRLYGRPLPHITSETGDVCDMRLHRGNFKEWRPEVSSDDFNRRDFVSHMQRPDEITIWARITHNGGGLRCYLTNVPEYRKRKGLRLVKRYIEIYRWNRQYMDGVSFNTTSESVATFNKAEASGSNECEPWPGVPLGELVIVDPIFDFRDSNQPLIALARMETERPLAGTTLKGEVKLINDLAKDAKCQLTVQLRGADGKMLWTKTADPVSIASTGELLQKLEVPLSNSLSTGWYKLEFFLHSGQELYSGNGYDLYILGVKDRLKYVATSKRVALYDSSVDGATASLLKSLNIPYATLSNSVALSKCDVLIVGRNSLDMDLRAMGDDIRAWLQGGGRLLCLDQSKPGDLPWQHGMRIEKRSDGSFVEMLRPQHPVFKGFDSDMVFDRGGGAIFFTTLSNNESVLGLVAADNTAEYLDTTQAMGSAVSDLRIGKGECLISTVRTDLYGKESTVTQYVENCLRYILSDEISPEAVEVAVKSAGKVIRVRGASEFIDISKVANRGLKDQGDGKGWADFGSNDMAGLQAGVSSLDGYVPFRIIDEARNEGRACIVLKGPTREQFPEKSGEVQLNQAYSSLYFLHTAMYVKGKKTDSNAIVNYVIHYSDGTESVFSARNGSEIADWSPARDDLKEAQLVFRYKDRALYVTEWKSPKPRAVISWIRMESTEQGIPILIAITGVKPDINITE